MKTNWSAKRIMTSVIPLVGMALTGCGKDNVVGPSPDPDPVTEAVTQITGTASIPVGMTGDLANARIAIYATELDWQRDVMLKTVAAVGSGASVQFTFPNLPAGTYYLDAWKDVNNDGLFRFPDLYGWFGTDDFPSGQPKPLLVQDGETVNVTITMRQIPGGPLPAIPGFRARTRTIE